MESQRSYMVFSKSVNEKAWTKRVMIPQRLFNSPNTLGSHQLATESMNDLLDNSDAMFEGGRQL